MSDPQTTESPPLNSLHDWHVGATQDGRSEVRVVLNDPAEARAWCQWMLNQTEKMAEEL